MKNLLFLFCFSFLFLSCVDKTQYESEIVLKEYGKSLIDSSSVSVNLEIDSLKSYKSLLERVNGLVCEDKTPIITLNNGLKKKKVYIHNPCWERFGCILIKQRNIIRIHNDSVFKPNGRSDLLPIDSLYSVLKKDYENNGKITTWSQNSEKLIINITIGKGKFKVLPKILNELTNSFDKLNGPNEVTVFLDEKYDLPPPPSPPNLN